jgi:hypothetical protein
MSSPVSAFLRAGGCGWVSPADNVRLCGGSERVPEPLVILKVMSRLDRGSVSDLPPDCGRETKAVAVRVMTSPIVCVSVLDDRLNSGCKTFTVALLLVDSVELALLHLARNNAKELVVMAGQLHCAVLVMLRPQSIMTNSPLLLKGSLNVSKLQLPNPA